MGTQVERRGGSVHGSQPGPYLKSGRTMRLLEDGYACQALEIVAENNHVQYEMQCIPIPNARSGFVPFVTEANQFRSQSAAIG